MADDVLSQSEIDKLLSALSEGTVSAEEVKADEAQKKVKPYDFKRPDKFSKDQIRTLYMMHENFARILNTAEMVIPDGVGVKIGLKILGYNVDRIAGIDFARKMLELSAKNNLPVAIIGAKPEVIKLAGDNLTKEIEGLNIVYSQDGYFSDENVVLEDLKQSGARLVLVALGSPKQEKFINKAKSILQFGLMVGVGGSFDVWSGTVERAPEIYQRLGIEWLYRTVKQPERFKRIFPTLPLFILRILKSKFIK